MPKQEMKVAEGLTKRSFEVFLPLHKTIRQWSDRKKMIQLPLFPNYVFIRAFDHERMRVFEVPGVVRFLSTDGMPDSLSNKDVLLIQNILGSNPEVCDYHLKRGERVRVISGPFKGLAGEIENRNGHCRLSLHIESLNRIVKFEIALNAVEPIA